MNLSFVFSKNLFVLGVLCSACALLACGQTEASAPPTTTATATTTTTAQQAQPKTYQATGQVRRIERERKTVTIHHDNVPGYMPAMTMPFQLETLSQVDGMAANDHVTFVFRPEDGGRHVIVRIRKIDPPANH